jgi:hypothetical protein
MQIATHRTLDDNIPAQDSAKYHINAAATVHIARILRNMYKDPVQAVVREYLANAIDAHKDSNQLRPIDMHTPTLSSPVFRIRDYGTGLSIDAVKMLLLGFGSSGDAKRLSNDQIGGFGIGCKCAFAVSDTFTYTSWYAGSQQTWLCQLDDNDMGEAKLVSNVPSDEHSGIQVEIPVAKSQLALYSKHIVSVPFFVQTPLRIDGALMQTTDKYVTYMHGDMGTTAPGAVWEFCTRKEGHECPGKTLVVMGDMWYPLELDYLKLTDESRVLAVLNIAGTYLVIKLPIGTLAIAPTRETLQYDNNTRTRLLELLDALEQNLQLQAQIMLNKQETVWLAASLAIKLKSDCMYALLEYHGKFSSKEPAFEWRGKVYSYYTHLALPAGPQPSGVSLTFVTRDTKPSKSSGYRSRQREYAKNYADYAPATSALKTFKFDITRECTVFTRHQDDYTVNGAPNSSMIYVGTLVGLNIVKTSHVAPITAVVDADSIVRRYLCPRPFCVYTLPPRVSAEFYAKKYLIAGNRYIPHDDGKLLVVQGTDAQLKKFFKEYPWLAHNLTQLYAPASVATRTVKRKSTQRTDVLAYDKMSANHDRPSTAWKTKALPDGEKIIVHLDRCLPELRTGYTHLAAYCKFARLNALIAMLDAITGKQNIVYGIKAINADYAHLDGQIHIEQKLDNVLQEWYDPKNIDKYPIHSFQLLLCHGPLTLFNSMHLPTNLLATNTENGSNNHKANLLKLLTKETVHKLVMYKFDITSPIRILASHIWKLLDLDRNSLHTYNAMRAIVQNCSQYIYVKDSKLMHMRASQQSAFVKYVKPVQQALDDVWKSYVLLAELKKIGTHAESASCMLDYIKMVDNARKRR